MSQEGGKRDKLPTIHEKDGKRYVNISGKKVWLGKDVTKKDLLKFIRKRMKSKKKGTSRKKTKKKTTKKKTTKKKVVVEERKFAENVSRSFVGALPFQRPPEPRVDEDAIARKVEDRVEKHIYNPMLTIKKACSSYEERTFY